MTADIERIKFELLTAYDRDGRLDIADWARRFPEHREELLDFWLWARRATGEPDDTAAPNQPRVSRVQEEALQRACLSISLGPQWLKPLVAESDARHISQQIQRVCRERPSATPATRLPFRRAVVYAWIVDQLAAVRHRVTRLAVQKTAYLLEEALKLGLFEGHRQKPLGPYDHSARYRDAEPIASKKGWILISGATLAAGKRTDEFHRYASRYLRSLSTARKLARLFGTLTDDQLETWATVLWVVSSHTITDRVHTASDIREALKQDDRWSSKLRRKNFAEKPIQEALSGLRSLGMVSSR